MASDGLAARESGPWALDKLAPLERYCQIVTTAMRGKFRGLAFVDLMAGPGLCIDTRSQVTSEFRGSTLRALDMQFPFSRVIAVDSIKTHVDALTKRVSQHPRGVLAEVLHGNCNNPAIIRAIREHCYGCLVVAFVDLLGTEVRMATLRALTDGLAADLVITWPEMDVNRNRGAMLEQDSRWDDFFGTATWQPLVRQLGPMFRLRSLQKLYVRQLRAFDYTHTQFIGSVRNLRGRALYRPLFASKHARGLDFWKKAADFQRSQPGLVGLDL